MTRAMMILAPSQDALPIQCAYAFSSLVSFSKLAATFKPQTGAFTSALYRVRSEADRVDILATEGDFTWLTICCSLCAGRT